MKFFEWLCAGHCAVLTRKSGIHRCHLDIYVQIHMTGLLPGSSLLQEHVILYSIVETSFWS
jgi:hypothetical protein